MTENVPAKSFAACATWSRRVELPWELLDLNDVVTRATRLVNPDATGTRLSNKR